MIELTAAFIAGWSAFAIALFLLAVIAAQWVDWES